METSKWQHLGRLAPYMEDCAELDEKFNFTSLYEPRMANVAFLTLALAGEVGELVNIVKKIWRDGEDSELWQKFDEEMVDILIYFVELLNVTRSPFDEAWKKKHEILNNRLKAQEGYCVADKPLDMLRSCKDICTRVKAEPGICKYCSDFRFYYTDAEEGS